MRSYHTYNYILLLSVFLFSISLSACGKKPDLPVINNLTSSPLPTISHVITDTDEPTEIPTPSNPDLSVSVGSNDITSTKETTGTSDKTAKLGEQLSVRGVTISLGEDKESVVNKLGSPNRIDATEYNFDYYIYNNDYSRLVFVAINQKGNVVGYYTDSLDFHFLGIDSGSSLQNVNQALNQTFSIGKVLTKRTDEYKVKVLMDKQGTQRVTGIYVLSNSVKKGKFTKTVMNHVELMVFDLVNSIRARNNEDVLSWSSTAALSTRKHSVDMAKNDYFSHTNLIGRKPNERLMEEGIFYNICDENIIAGYGTAILSTHSLFNSYNNRQTILNSKYRYTGVGFAYLPHSTYKTYITQIFYR